MGDDLTMSDDLNLADDDMGDVETGFIFDEPLVSTPKEFASIPAHRIKAEHAQRLALELPMPPERGYVECLIAGSFIFGDLFAPMCARLGGGVEVVLSTLSYCIENVDAWKVMLEDGLATSIQVVVSDYFYQHERSATYRQTWEQLREQVAAGTFRLAVAGTHAKVACLANDRFKVVLRGSANLRSSENVEEFMFQRDADSWAFHRAWMLRVLDRYAVTRRSLRHTALFDTI